MAEINVRLAGPSPGAFHQAFATFESKPDPSAAPVEAEFVVYNETVLRALDAPLDRPLFAFAATPQA